MSSLIGFGWKIDLHEIHERALDSATLLSCQLLQVDSDCRVTGNAVLAVTTLESPVPAFIRNGFLSRLTAATNQPIVVLIGSHRYMDVPAIPVYQGILENKAIEPSLAKSFAYLQDRDALCLVL